MENNDTGLLLNKQNIQLHRNWFKEMTKLIGIIVGYRHPLPDDKDYNLYGEIKTAYSEPIKVGVVYDEHPSQWTMRKLGWASEMDENLSVIHVPYDLPGLEVGCLFIIPPGVDGGSPRTFRVVKMSTTAVYPASVSCFIGPMMDDTFEESLAKDFSKTNFNAIAEEED